MIRIAARTINDPGQCISACEPAIRVSGRPAARIAASVAFGCWPACCWWPDARRRSTRTPGSPASARRGRRPSRSRCPALPEPSFVAADGQVLPLRKWLPRGAVKAVILALHGFNDYSNAFEGPGEAWAERGIATYAYDQRGFGAAPERGLWPGRAALAADAATAARILRRLYPRVPLYLLGESMGGAVAVVAMTGESGTPVPDVDGVILTAPAVWGRATMDLLPRLALWAGVRLMPGLTLTGRGLKIKPSDNIAMLRALSRDPLVIKATRVDTIYGLVDLMDAALDSAPFLDAPMLVMYGAKDEIVPKTPIRRFVGEPAAGMPPPGEARLVRGWLPHAVARSRRPGGQSPMSRAGCSHPTRAAAVGRRPRRGRGLPAAAAASCR